MYRFAGSDKDLSSCKEWVARVNTGGAAKVSFQGLVLSGGVDFYASSSVLDRTIIGEVLNIWRFRTLGAGPPLEIMIFVRIGGSKGEFYDGGMIHTDACGKLRIKRS